MSDINRQKIMIYYGGFRDILGGVNSHISNLEKEYKNQGYQVETISLDRLPILLRYIPHLVERISNVFYFPLGFVYKGLVAKFFYKTFFKNNSDINIFEDIYLAWNSSTPSVCILHAAWSDNLQAFKVSKEQMERLKNKEINLINAIEHPVVTVSFEYKNYLEKEHFGSKLKKDLGVVLLGIDNKLFNINHRSEISNSKSIITTSHLEARKNIFFLLKLFKKIYEADDSYSLSIIGDGPERKAVEDYIKQNKLPVTLHGRVNHDDVVKILHEHELFIHTSVKESFSYALLEAKLAGLITVAYSGLQVPSEFIDIKQKNFELNNWLDSILNKEQNYPMFDVNKYTVKIMADKTLENIK